MELVQKYSKKLVVPLEYMFIFDTHTLEGFLYSLRWFLSQMLFELILLGIWQRKVGQSREHMIDYYHSFIFTIYLIARSMCKLLSDMPALFCLTLSAIVLVMYLFFPQISRLFVGISLFFRVPFAPNVSGYGAWICSFHAYTFPILC